MKETKIFLDTNFLIATQIAEHPFNAQAKNLLAKFYVAEYIPLTHPIVFDEFWYVLMGLHGKNSQTAKYIKKSTENIFKFKNFALVRPALSQKDLLSTLDLMDKYSLKPRDALILKIMKIEKLNKIATFDKHFDNISKISVMS